MKCGVKAFQFFQNRTLFHVATINYSGEFRPQEVQATEPHWTNNCRAKASVLACQRNAAIRSHQKYSLHCLPEMLHSSFHDTFTKSCQNQAYSRPRWKNTMECVQCNIAEHLKNGCVPSITTDLWTSPSKDSFISLTIHLVNADFRWKMIVLRCIRYNTAHTAQEISKALTGNTNFSTVMNTICGKY